MASQAAAQAPVHEAPPTPFAKKLKTSSVPSTVPDHKRTGVMAYLQNYLPRSSLLELYQDESRGRYVCRAVLQRLPQTSQQVIIRLASCGGSFTRSALSIWTKYKTPGKVERDIDELYQWAIIQDDSRGSSNEITLTPEFFQGLKDSLQSLDASPWTALTQEQIEILEQEATMVLGKPVTFPTMTPEDLEKYAQDQLDAVLHYLVGTHNMQIQPNPAISQFLLKTNLIQPDPAYKGDEPDEPPLVITHKGYDFILQDNSQQAWHFVMYYLKSMDTHAEAQALQKETLLVLICLSFSRFGACYAAAALLKMGESL